MTPPRLNELECPSCHKTSWIIDSDYRGIDGAATPYTERLYSCRPCGKSGVGWALIQQSPPEFLIQPHDLYPMTQDAFDHWLGILREACPDHPLLADLGRTFVPRLPGIGWRLKTWFTRRGLA